MEMPLLNLRAGIMKFFIPFDWHLSSEICIKGIQRFAIHPQNLSHFCMSASAHTQLDENPVSLQIYMVMSCVNL